MSSNIKTSENTDNLSVKDSADIAESLTNIYKDAVKYAPSKIVGVAVNLIMVSVYTSILSPKDYGLYMVSTAVISFLAIIFSDWIGSSALRFFREHFIKDNIENYFSTILFLLATNLLIMYILGFFLYKPLEDFFRIPSKFLFMVFLLLIPIAIRALLFQVLRAQIKPLVYTFSTIANQILTISVSVFLVKQFNLGAMALLAGMSFSIVVIDFLLLVQTSYHKLISGRLIKFDIMHNLYKYGGPLAAASMGMWLITQSNRFILQYYKGSYYNGQLGVGFNLTYSIMMPLFAIITMAAIPRLINKYEDKLDVKPIISKISDIYLLIFMPMTFVLCIYPRETILIFSNKTFADAYVLLPFLSISAFILGLAEIATIKYYLVKKTWIDMIIRLLSGFTGVVANIILIPVSPLIGIGVSALLSNFMYLLFSFRIKIPNLDWKMPYKTILMSFAALSLCYAASFLLKYTILPSNFLGYASHVLLILGIYALFVKYAHKLFASF